MPVFGSSLAGRKEGRGPTSLITPCGRPTEITEITKIRIAEISLRRSHDGASQRTPRPAVSS
eukprot:2649668-Prymnesium_polylepis.1